MNLKYYIRGIGVGILFTAVVMSVAFHIFPNQKLTDAQIKERAKELGMVESEAAGSLDDLLTTPTPTSTQAPTGTQTPTETPTPSATPASDDTSKEDASQNTSDAAGTADTGKADKSDASDTIEINITKGMTSEQVSKLLKEKGIIEDSDAFSQYLVINNYTKSIKTGNFQLNAYTAYKDIVNLIIDK